MIDRNHSLAEGFALLTILLTDCALTLPVSLMRCLQSPELALYRLPAASSIFSRCSCLSPVKPRDVCYFLSCSLAPDIFLFFCGGFFDYYFIFLFVSSKAWVHIEFTVGIKSSVVRPDGDEMVRWVQDWSDQPRHEIPNRLIASTTENKFVTKRYILCICCSVSGDSTVLWRLPASPQFPVHTSRSIKHKRTHALQMQT